MAAPVADAEPEPDHPETGSDASTHSQVPELTTPNIDGPPQYPVSSLKEDPAKKASRKPGNDFWKRVGGELDAVSLDNPPKEGKFLPPYCESTVIFTHTAIARAAALSTRSGNPRADITREAIFGTDEFFREYADLQETWWNEPMRMARLAWPFKITYHVFGVEKSEITTLVVRMPSRDAGPPFPWGAGFRTNV